MAKKVYQINSKLLKFLPAWFPVLTKQNKMVRLMECENKMWFGTMPDGTKSGFTHDAPVVVEAAKYEKALIKRIEETFPVPPVAVVKWEDGTVSVIVLDVDKKEVQVPISFDPFPDLIGYRKSL